ncbi:Uncharacterised protein [Mycobacteroides abscessus subsp. abscessus]|nr:Uncharacterised protein [Mycobacteroides abscessus subsp. abscessus]
MMTMEKKQNRMAQFFRNFVLHLHYELIRLIFLIVQQVITRQSHS